MSEVKKKILIVDDEKELCDLLADHFEDKGYETFTAYDGLDAKKLLLTNKYDLILTDILMPKMSGVDLLMFLQGVENPPPVIVITGFTDNEEKDLQNLGAYAVFYKPIDYKRLENMVKEVLYVDSE